MQASSNNQADITKYEEITKNPAKYHVNLSYIKFLGKHPRKICLLYVVITILVAVYAVGIFNLLNGSGGFVAPDAESTKTDRYFTREFVPPSPDVIALLEHHAWTVDSDNYKDAYYQFKGNLQSDITEAFGIVSYFDYNFITGFVSTDRKKSIVTFRLPQEIVDNNKLDYSDFEKTTVDNPLKISFSGTLLGNEALTNQLSKDLLNIEFGSVPVLLVILVFAFGGLSAVLVPISLMIFAVVFTFGALRLLTLGFEVSSYVIDVTAIFGIGLAIDFSIFISLRYKEEITKALNENPLNEPHDRWDDELVLQSLEKALLTSGRTVLFSSILLVTTLSGALQFHEYFITTMSLAVIFPAIFAAFGAVTYVPVIYILLNHKIKYLSTDRLVSYVLNYFSIGYKKINSNIDTKIDNNESKLDKQIEMVVINSDADIEANEQIDSQTNNQTGKQIDTQIDKQSDNEMNFKLSKSNNYYLSRYLPYPSTRFSNLPGYYDINDENDPIFMLIYTVMTYPIVFIVVILSCLIALFVIFCVNIKFANSSYGNLPLHSTARYVSESNSKYFPSYGKTALNVFIRTSSSYGVRDETFLSLLNSYTYLLGNHSSVVDVGSMMNFDKSKNYSTLIKYYGDPYNPNYYNFTKQLVDPFYLTDFNQITAVTVSLSIVESDPNVGEVVRFVRHLTENHFIVSSDSQTVNSVDIQLSANYLSTDSTNYQTNEQANNLRQLSSSFSLLSQYGVTGSPAQQYDVNTDVKKVLPDFIAVVVLTMFFFVLLLTNSVVLPFKAIFLSIVSIGGSFGFLLLVYQNNTGTSTLKFYNPEKALDPLQLLFIFVVSFGLSLDYEVFILGRIQELYNRTKDNKYAVSKGIASSATSISLAAMLLCIALGGFLASKIMILQMIGMGIGLTIMLDATVIRTILLPAIMSLLGDYAWYCPKPLSEIIEYIGIKE